jgi:hypothetical protein
MFDHAQVNHARLFHIHPKLKCFIHPFQHDMALRSGKVDEPTLSHTHCFAPQRTKLLPFPTDTSTVTRPRGQYRGRVALIA